MLDTVGIASSIRSFEKLVAVLYTEESYAKAKYYYDVAVAVLADPGSIQESLSKASLDLNNAMRALRNATDIDASGIVSLDENQGVVTDGDTFAVDGGTVTMDVTDREVDASFEAS